MSLRARDLNKRHESMVKRTDQPIGVLVFVHIPTHFSEMVRVVELLSTSKTYRPVVIFAAMYTGVERDIGLCRALGAEVVTEPELHRYRPADVQQPRWSKTRRVGRYLRTSLRNCVQKCKAWNILVSSGIASRRSKANATLHAIKNQLTRTVLVLTAQIMPGFPRILPSEILAGARKLRRRTRPIAKHGLQICRALGGFFQRQANIGLLRVHNGVSNTVRLTLCGTLAGVRKLLRRAKPVAKHGLYICEALGGFFQRQAHVGLLRVRHGTRSLVRLTWRWLYSPTPTARARSTDTSARGVAQSIALGLTAMVGLLAYPLRLPLRLLAVSLFGLWYRRFTPYLPPDILAQYHVARSVPGLLHAQDIGLVVLPEDNFYYFTNFYVKAVHERGGGAIIVPFTIVNMLEWAEAFYKEPSHDADLMINAAIAFLFPSWSHKHRGRSLVMPFQQVLCNEYFKTTPPVPWLINSGHADAIAVESAFMYQYYLRSGIKADRLHLTGALYDDALHHTLTHAPMLRQSLYQRLSLPKDRPMLLCALPPNQLAGTGRAQCDFSDYHQILQAFLMPLRRLCSTHNCVLSLHPRIDPNSLLALDLTGFHIVSDSVAKLIPLSQLYIASCSATIRLAINCGVPVVNYDVYRYDYDDYKTIPGVLTIEDQAQYEQAVANLCTMPDEYTRIHELLRKFSAEHTVLDGKAGTRLLALMDEVMNRTVA